MQTPGAGTPDAIADASFDRFAALVRRTLGVPTALVTLVEDARQIFPGADGLPEPWQSRRETPLSHSFCQHVVANAEPLVIADARQDPVLRTNLAIGDLNVVAYAGMPLTSWTGTVIGSLCAIDSAPREWTESELATLADLAQACSSELQLRDAAAAARSESARVRMLVDSMPVGFVNLDKDFRITAANTLGARLVGSTVEGLVGRVAWELFPELGASAFGRTCRRVARTGETEVVEAHYPAPLDGWFDVTAIRENVGVSLFFTDVSERHRGQARLERTAAHDRSVAQTLQQALLTALPEPDHLQLVAHYVTAAAVDQVGGDWYDALVDAHGATTVIIGDVAGHDINAAALMGQLRSMLRAFVWEHPDDPPSAALIRLDAAMRQLQIATTASVFIGRIEQDDAEAARDVRTLHWSIAGHLPPILITAAGVAGLLTADGGGVFRPDVILGARSRAARHDHRTVIDTGSTLLLYTDGLVESRQADLDVGIAALTASAAAHHRLEPQAFLAQLTADLVGDTPEDDVATLAVRFHSERQPRPPAHQCGTA